MRSSCWKTCVEDKETMAHEHREIPMQLDDQDGIVDQIMWFMMQVQSWFIDVYCLTFPVSYSHAEDVSIAVDARMEDVKYELQVGSRSFQMGMALADCAEN